MRLLSALTLILVAGYVEADLKAFDVSQAQAPFNSNFWACAGSAGYGKAVIRAYQQACGSVSIMSRTTIKNSPKH